jgi:hypothetical protein
VAGKEKRRADGYFSQCLPQWNSILEFLIFAKKDDTEVSGANVYKGNEENEEGVEQEETEGTEGEIPEGRMMESEILTTKYAKHTKGDGEKLKWGMKKLNH